MFGKLLIPLTLLSAAAAAQELPQFSPFVLHRYTVAAAAPDFSAQAFRATDLRTTRLATPTYWDALRPMPTPNAPRPLNIPMLRTLQHNRVIAMLAGGVPKLEQMFDEDSILKRRIAVSPMIDLDSGIGIRVKIRLQ
jgi:hypothetical protein